jgi:hypothetical protein
LEVGQPSAFGDQVDRSNLQITSSGKVKRTGEHFSWYLSDDLRVKIQLPSCRQYKSGDCLAVRPLNWKDITDEDDNDENWVDPGALSGGMSRPGNGNYNDNCDGDEDMQGGEKGTGNWKGMKAGNRKGHGRRKGNGQEKGSVKHTPGGDDISRAVAL